MVETRDNKFPEMNEVDKKLFLKTLNKTGFILEDKVWKLLSETGDITLKKWSRGDIYNYQGDRAEIDFVASTEKHDFIIECKKTDYSWIFSKALERSNVLNLIVWEGDNVGYVESHNTEKFKTAWTQIGVLVNEKGKLEKKDRNELKVPKENRNDLHKHVRQTLKEVGAYLEHNFPQENKIIVPLIVTSADLYYVDYNKGSINNKGDLVDFSSIRKINGLAFNISDFIEYSDKNSKNSMNIQAIFGNHQIKTVFIVNVNYLTKFMKEIIDETDSLIH